MVKQRRTYTGEFKREAVRLAEESQQSAADVARQLGVHPNLLYKWRKALREDEGHPFPGQGQGHAADEEVRQLRRENVRLREELEILKKAMVFFVRESR